MDFCKDCGMIKERCRCHKQSKQSSIDNKSHNTKKNINRKIKKTKTKKSKTITKQGSKDKKNLKESQLNQSERDINKYIKKNWVKGSPKKIISKEIDSKKLSSKETESKKTSSQKISSNEKNTKETTPKETKLEKLSRKYPNIDNKIIENFPFDEPRVDQFEIISEISEAIDEGYKYIVLEAGTGTGKSVIGATLAKMYSPAYILTMTKQLQDQYLEDFENDGFTLVKGRGNFDCKEKELYSGDLGVRCDRGTCKERYRFLCNYKLRQVDEDVKTNLEHAFGDMYWKSDIHCNYLEQKVEGIKSDVVIANYDYAMLELNYVGDFEKRKLLILDEAHNLESKIMRFIELEIDRKRLESEVKIKVSDEEIKNLHKVGHEAWISFVMSLISRYQKEVIKYERKLKTAKKSKKEDNEKVLKGLTDELDDYERFISYMEDDYDNWILEDNEEFIYFKPLKIDKYAKDYLFRFGEICLFMSATILDYKSFSSWLGLKQRDVKFIEAETPFEPAKRPIDISKSVNMRYENLDVNAPRTLKFIEDILDKHKNDKGLIHTVSYKCSDFLKKNLKDPRIITHTSKNRMKVLKEFEESDKPLVLLSPSLNEGVDLPYDKCRFQIIYKIPFPPIMDKQVSLRTKKDSNWYPYQTMMNLVQTYGRGMRAEDDYCQTYVIDKRLKFYAYNSPKYRRFVPKFFKEAIVDDE